MRRSALPPILPIALLLALSGCGPQEEVAHVPGDRMDTHPYAGVPATEVVQFVGTEPFWGGRVLEGSFTYTTPETPEGETVSVKRFEGRGGLSWSGTLSGGAFTMTVTPSKCSDGMSDRTFPFVATLQIGDTLRSGCAWTDKQPFTGPKAP